MMWSSIFSSPSAVSIVMVVMAFVSVNRVFYHGRLWWWEIPLLPRQSEFMRTAWVRLETGCTALVDR